MNTEWVCFVCSGKNGIEETYCVSCGAHRPFAVQAFASHSGEDWEGSNEYSGALLVDDENRILEALENLAADTAAQDIEIKAFAKQIKLIFSALDDTAARLREDLKRVDGHTPYENLDVRLRDACYIYRLARIQFDMYAPDNKKCVEVGVLLAQQAHRGLKFVAESIRRRQESANSEDGESLGKAIAGFTEGEIDFDTYFDSVCAADEALHKLMQEGRDLYFKALEEAEAFDGGNYQVLEAAGRSLAKAVDKWLKAAAVVS